MKLNRMQLRKLIMETIVLNEDDHPEEYGLTLLPLIVNFVEKNYGKDFGIEVTAGRPSSYGKSRAGNDVSFVGNLEVKKDSLFGKDYSEKTMDQLLNTLKKKFGVEIIGTEVAQATHHFIGEMYKKIPA